MGDTTLISIDSGGAIIVYSDYRDVSASRRTWAKAEALKYYDMMSVERIMTTEERLEQL